ncbi:MAG: hypothetical protein HQL95_05520 [Magnetococcales bacterium]|nr:hypothetical protein [Magnetococcales bacterium]
MPDIEAAGFPGYWWVIDQLIACLLKEMFDLTDEALNRLHFRPDRLG